MLLLPTVIGSWTLARRLGSDGLVERLAATSAEGRPALARRLEEAQLRDPGRRAAVAARARDILGVRHPSIVPALDLITDGASITLIEEAPDAVGLDKLLAYHRAAGEALPPHIFLHIATQICNALEALHGRPSPAAGADQLLHLGLRPSAVMVSREGRVRLGRLALVPGVGPLLDAEGADAALEHLAPEQTHTDQRLSPATDVFALGSLLTELLTLQPLFRDQTPMKTIQRVRRADINDAMAEAQALLPGVEVPLYRSMALNPRHRYQRAFVLREDLRGLMAEFSFKTIHEELAALAAPVFVWEDPDDAPAPAPEALDEWSPVTEQRLDPDRQEAVTQREDDPFALDERTDPDAAAEFEVSMPLIRALRENTIPPDDDSLDADPEDEAPPARPSFPSASTSLEDAETLAPDDDEPDADAEDEAPPARPSFPSGPVSLEDAETLAPDEPDEPPSAQAAPAVTTWPPESSVPPPPEPPPPEPPTPEPPPTQRRGWVDANTTLPPDDDSLDLADEPKAPPSPPVDPLLNAARILSAAPPPRPSFPSKPMSQEEAPTVPPVEPRPKRPVTAIPVQRRATPAGAPLSRSEDTWVPDELPSSALRATPTPPPRPVEPTPPLPPAPTPQAAAAPPAAESPRPWVALVLLPAALLVFTCGGLGLWWLQRAPQPAVVEAPAVTTPIPAAPVVEPPTVEAPPAEAPAVEAPPAEAPEPTPVEAPVAEAPPVEAPPTPRPPTTSGAPRKVTSRPPPVVISAPLPVPAAAPVSTATVTAQLAETARQGALNPAEVSTLEAVPISSEEYTRSRALLVQNAERRGDTEAALRYLDQLFKLDENRYNPVYLARASVHLVNKQRYAEALTKANEAERYWARIPADQMDRTQTDIYASQASAALGLFYADPDDAALLDRSIRAWERYRQHAAARGDSTRVAKADAEISRLRDMQARME